MTWTPLHLSPVASGILPPILIASSFSPDAYTVHLTDLTNIWSESLKRSDIVQRSQEENTSIDPSDREQLQILLQKIELGLAEGDGTTSALSIHTDEGRPGLTLNLTVKLPGGFAPLQWPVRLAASPQSLLTSHLMVPLLEAQHARMQEMASLAEIMKEKDHVIQKLLDKLESQGTELGQVFPQAAGKAGRKLSRQQAEERVKGLATFNLNACRNSVDTKPSHDRGHLISEVFKSDGGYGMRIGPGKQSPAPYSDEIEATESWWNNIKGITVYLKTGKISTSISRPNLRDIKPLPKQNASKAVKKEEPAKSHSFDPSKDNIYDDDDDDDDAFQVQATPLSRKSKASKSAPPKSPINDSTDSDDEDLDAPSQRSKVPDSIPTSQPLPLSQPSFWASASPSPPKKTKKLGTIGEKKAAPAAPVNEDGSTEDGGSPLSKPSKKMEKLGTQKVSSKPIDDEDTATEDDEFSSPKPHKNMSRLGSEKVSQKSNNDGDGETSTEDEAVSLPKSSPPKPAPPKPKKAMLGKIGGKKKPSKAPTPEPPEDKASLPEPEAPKPKKAKLGKLGGKKTRNVEQENNTPSPAPDETKISTPKKKIGTIGGRKIKTETSPEKELETRGRTEVREEKEKTPEKRETSSERADRKRAALKRELEEKSKAPVKKKRKF
ncbi:hypothetical protein G7Y89_g9348 [Cudoniella acicularis]|uniref:Non-homologous end-joining factor 1 n=1 Tax=Cudoniella acicularis TaxID=354080 RepID=A0A8H4RGD2_9HELO|nr:hypothetical protein G7Y89_g9348 [Cudoniella acicularis]